MNPWPDLLRRPGRLTDAVGRRVVRRDRRPPPEPDAMVIAGTAAPADRDRVLLPRPGPPRSVHSRRPGPGHAGRWYFHKTAGVYRGGSFKGVDVTFGDDEARGGILFRGLETPDGRSSTARRCLSITCCALRAADRRGTRPGHRRRARRGKPRSPLHFDRSPEPAEGRSRLRPRRPVAPAGRAGSTMPPYLTRPYRFLTEPAAIAKGKVQMVMALHRAGRVSRRRFGEATGCPQPTIATYIAEYEAGCAQVGSRTISARRSARETCAGCTGSPTERDGQSGVTSCRSSLAGRLYPLD